MKPTRPKARTIEQQHARAIYTRLDFIQQHLNTLEGHQESKFMRGFRHTKIYDHAESIEKYCLRNNK